MGLVTTRISPGSSTGILDRFASRGWATTTAETDYVLGSVAPDVLLFLYQRHYGVDKWGNCDVGYGADRPAAMENGQCVALLP